MGRRADVIELLDHFASLVANHQVSYKKALAWLGHSDSEMLSIYYHLHDEESERSMRALAESSPWSPAWPPAARARACAPSARRAPPPPGCRPYA